MLRNIGAIVGGYLITAISRRDRSASLVLSTTTCFDYPCHSFGWCSLYEASSPKKKKRSFLILAKIVYYFLKASEQGAFLLYIYLLK